MNNRIRLAICIRVVSRYRMIASVDIELVSLSVLLIHVYLADMLPFKGIAEQGRALTFAHPFR